MSTRCLIARKINDKEYESIYCHFDGGSYVKSVLNEHYTDLEKVKELMSLGSISSLRPRLAPNEGENHSFENPVEDIVVAYHRDRGEPYQGPEKHICKEELLLDAGWVDYIHIFDEESKYWQTIRH